MGPIPSRLFAYFIENSTGNFYGHKFGNSSNSYYRDSFHNSSGIFFVNFFSNFFVNLSRYSFGNFSKKKTYGKFSNNCFENCSGNFFVNKKKKYLEIWKLNCWLVCKKILKRFSKKNSKKLMKNFLGNSQTNCRIIFCPQSFQKSCQKTLIRIAKAIPVKEWMIFNAIDRIKSLIELSRNIS